MGWNVRRFEENINKFNGDNSMTFKKVQESKEIALSIGLPVVVRPAYTLGGTGGGIAETLEELEKIAESGIKSREDMNYLKLNNIKVFLIGESLMRGSF